MRAFVQMRELLGSTKDLAKQLAALEKKLTERLDGHETAIVQVRRRMMDILDPSPLPEEVEPVPQREIGFHTKEEEAKPRAKRK